MEGGRIEKRKEERGGGGGFWKGEEEKERRKTEEIECRRERGSCKLFTNTVNFRTLHWPLL